MKLPSPTAIDIGISIAIIGLTTTCLATNPVYFAGMLLSDTAIKGALAYIHKRRWIENDEFIKCASFLSGCLVFSASFHFLSLPVASMFKYRWLAKAISTGFIPILANNLSAKVSDIIVLGESKEDHCLIGAFKYGLYKGFKSYYTPIEVVYLSQALEYFSGMFASYLASNLIVTGLTTNLLPNHSKAMDKLLLTDPIQSVFTVARAFNTSFNKAWQSGLSSVAAGLFISLSTETFGRETFHVVYSLSKSILRPYRIPVVSKAFLDEGKPSNNEPGPAR